MVKRGLILGGVLAIISLASFSYVYADTTGSTKFSVDVENTVLELTIPATPAVIDLNPTMTGASFGSTSINVKVATNNITGYQLTMTPTNSQTNTSLIRTELVGSESTYREIETLDLTDPVSTGYPEADFTANRWGYKITGDNYYGIDPNNTTVSHPAWITNEPTNGTNHSLTLAAKVDAETVSGSYETTLNFRAVTNATIAKDTISFNANGGTGTMNDITVTAGNSTALPANTFTPPTGMKFIGWSTTQNGQSQGVRYYDDEATYTATDTGYNVNLTLYAIWANENFPSSTTPAGVTGTTISRAYEIAYTAAGKGMWERDEGDHDNDGDTNEYYQVQDGVYHNYDVRWDMQGMTSEICDSVTVLDDSYLAIDTRDFNKYHIAKLQDGRCWMQDNLAFDAVTLKTRLSSTNTNATQAAIDNFIVDSSTAPQSGWATTAVSYETSSSVYNQPRINIGIKDVIPQGDDPLKDLAQAEGWKVGVFYNYCATSVGTYCYPNYGSSVDPDATSAIDVKNDICAAGWRVPTGSSYDFTSRPDGGEYLALYNAYPSIDGGDKQYTRFRKAFRLPLSGEGGRNTPTRQGSYAFLWSSTFSDSSHWYIFRQEGAKTVYPDYSLGTRLDQSSVRCIAK